MYFGCILYSSKKNVCSSTNIHPTSCTFSVVVCSKAGNKKRGCELRGKHYLRGDLQQRRKQKKGGVNCGEKLTSKSIDTLLQVWKNKLNWLFRVGFPGFGVARSQEQRKYTGGFASHFQGIYCVHRVIGASDPYN